MIDLSILSSTCLRNTLLDPLSSAVGISGANFYSLDDGAWYTTSTGETLGNVGDNFGLGLNLGGMNGLPPQTYLDRNGITDLTTITGNIISDVSADQPTVVEADGGRSLLFDGVSDEIKITNSGQTYFCFGVQSTDVKAILLYSDEINGFAGVAYSGSTDNHGGTPVYIDSILVGESRDDLYQAAFDGQKHIVEIIGLDASTWGDTINMGAFTSYEFAGNIGPIITRDTTPTDAERALYRQYISSKFGASS